MSHVNEADTHKSVKYLGYEVKKGTLSTCEACAEAKAKQRSLPTRVVKTVTVIKSKIKVGKVSEQMHLDISTIKSPAGVNVTVDKPQWLILVDERTDMK
eukprot:2304399-Ditylum_brightwellii.AAC.1